jgi:hypothetical protein
MKGEILRPLATPVIVRATSRLVIIVKKRSSIQAVPRADPISLMVAAN